MWPKNPQKDFFYDNPTETREFLLVVQEKGSAFGKIHLTLSSWCFFFYLLNLEVMFVNFFPFDVSYRTFDLLGVLKALNVKMHSTRL